MTNKKKRNLQGLIVWLILMLSIYIIHGFPSLVWFLGSAWFCLIIGGILVLVWEKVSLNRKNQEFSEEETIKLNGIDAFIEGERLFLEKKYNEALEHFDNAIMNGFCENTYWMRASCLQEFEFHIEAIDDLNNAILLRPEDCNLYYMRSMSKKALSDYNGAIDDLNEAIDLSKMGNETNKIYNIEVSKIGWDKGIEDFYQHSISMVKMEMKMGGEYQRRKQKKNTKKRSNDL